MDRLLSISETSQFLGISEKTLYRWAALRKGPAWIKIGRSIRYRPEAISAFLAANENKPLEGIHNA